MPTDRQAIVPAWSAKQVAQTGPAEQIDDLHSSRPGVFSPPPRPIPSKARPAAEVRAARAQKGTRMTPLDETEDDEQQDQEGSNDQENHRDSRYTSSVNDEDKQDDGKRRSSSRVPERGMSLDEIAQSSNVTLTDTSSTTPRSFRPRLESAPSAGISHYRSRSHFSIPDVTVTTSEEEGNETHFELQLEHAKRRMMLPASEKGSALGQKDAARSDLDVGKLKFPSAPLDSSAQLRTRKERPPAIRVVDAEGNPTSALEVAQYPLPTSPTSPTAFQQSDDVSHGTGNVNQTGSKIGRRLRKSSLPNLFGKKERDAAHVAALRAMPASPTSPTPGLMEQLRHTSGPSAERSRSGSAGSEASLGARPSREKNGSATDRGEVSSPTSARPQMHKQFDGGSGSESSLTNDALSMSASPATSTAPTSTPHSPTSPTQSSRPYSPLSAFFASKSNNKSAGPLGSPTLTKKEIKQRQQEEKMLIKELEKVDKMVRKHDEKTLNAQKKAEGKRRKEQKPIVAEQPAAVVQPVNLDRQENHDVQPRIVPQEGRAKKALRRMTLFHANTSATPRANVPVRRGSVQRRSAVSPSHREDPNLQRQPQTLPPTNGNHLPNHTGTQYSQAPVRPSRPAQPPPLHLLRDRRRMDVQTHVDQPLPNAPDAGEAMPNAGGRERSWSAHDPARNESDWADVPSPVAASFTGRQSVEVGALPNHSASVRSQANSGAVSGHKTQESGQDIGHMTRTSSIKRALSARRRMSVAAGRSVRPRSGNENRTADSQADSQAVRTVRRQGSNTAAITTKSQEPAQTATPFARQRKPLLGDTDEATKARYRIESIVLEGADLGWEEELGLPSFADDDQMTPRGSGQVTPKPLHTSEDKRLGAEERASGPFTSPTKVDVDLSAPASPPPAMSLFDSLYKEVDAMEMSFGQKYPAEAEVRRKSLVASNRDSRRFSQVQDGRYRTSLSKDRQSVSGVPTTSDQSTESVPITAKTLPGGKAITSPDKKRSSGSSGSGSVRGRERASTGSSSATSSSSSSNAVPATPPLPSGFTAFKAPVDIPSPVPQAVQEPVPSLARSSIEELGPVRHSSPSEQGSMVSQSSASSPPASPLSSSPAAQASRRMRVGANPKGFRFPPPVPSPSHQSGTSAFPDGNIHARAGSLPLLSNEHAQQGMAAGGGTGAEEDQFTRSNSSPYAF